MCHTGNNHLLVQPEGFLGEHGEFFVRNSIQVHSWKVVSQIDHPLTDALLIGDCPAVYKPTKRLWRVEMISES